MDNPIYIFLTQFHKVMDTLSGRDKVTKALQYGAKVVSYGIDMKKQSVLRHLADIKVVEDHLDLDKQKVFYTRALKRTSNFESSISDARKVFRFFKSIGSLLDVYKFVINLHTHYWKKRKNQNSNTTDDKSPSSSIDNVALEFKVRWIDFVRIIQKFLLSIYILYDHASWAAKAGLFYDVSELNAAHIWQKLFNNSRAKNYSETSCKMWFIGTLLTLISDVYDYFETFNDEIKLLREKSECFKQIPEGFLNLYDFVSDGQQQTNAEIAKPSNARMSQIETRLKKVQDQKSQITRNLMKNTADLMVAGNGGYKVWSLNNAVIGLCGCASSFIGLYESWPSSSTTVATRK